MPRSRWVAAAAIAVLAGGCHHRAASQLPAGPSTRAALTTSTTEAPGTPPTSGVPPAPVAPATTGPAVAAAPTACATGALAVVASDAGAAAGTAYLDLVFTNTLAPACTLQGYPGVSFLDARGHSIGAPASRTGAAAALVTLTKGGAAQAVLAYHDAYVATAPGCQPEVAAAIRVSPPNRTAALTVPTHLMVCANPSAAATAAISPVTPPAAP
ncbi:MAG TPA: DUF4232 domain-containing protein [Acidimicrobiales bacterium]|jgi:hypothetical protein|nr:DUF4232 domain-containing protein [Acidimicrobiales bacterium]